MCFCKLAFFANRAFSICCSSCSGVRCIDVDIMRGFCTLCRLLKLTLSRLLPAETMDWSGLSPFIMTITSGRTRSYCIRVSKCMYFLSAFEL